VTGVGLEPARTSVFNAGRNNRQARFIVIHSQIQIILPRQNSQGPNAYLYKTFFVPVWQWNLAVAADIFKDHFHC